MVKSTTKRRPLLFSIFHFLFTKSESTFAHPKEMKRAKVIQSGVAFLVCVVVVGSFCAFRTPQGAIAKISMDMNARSLFQGKAVYGSGTVYYRTQGSLMVTKLHTPLEQVIMVNGTGEYKAYDRRSNSVQLMQSQELSSKGSFIYHFLNGKTDDMGLNAIGFKLTATRYDEDGILVKTFAAPVNATEKIDRAEIAYENNIPIFIGFFDAAGAPMYKTFYTNYQNVGYLPMPMTITEISYLSPTDSTILQKTYSNIKINGQVTGEWLDFSVPADAQIVSNLSENNVFGQ